MIRMSLNRAGVLAAIAALGLTIGCKSMREETAKPSLPGRQGTTVEICPRNVADGLATIICQPVDVEITRDQNAVSFEVEVSAPNAIYSWYAVRGTNDTDIYLGGENKGKYEGGSSPSLTIRHPDETDCGFYFCEIQTIDRFGLPVRVQTRRAALGTAIALTHNETAPITVVQPMPVPGSPGPAGSCGGSACSSVTFRNQAAGFKLPSGWNYFTVMLTNTVTHAYKTLAPSAYEIVVCAVQNGNGSANCAQHSGSRWALYASPTCTYLFAVYFICGQAGPSPSLPSVALWITTY